MLKYHLFASIENQNEVFNPQKLVEMHQNINLNYCQKIANPSKILPINQTPLEIILEYDYLTAIDYIICLV